MSETESYDCMDEISNVYQDRPAQDTLANGSVVRQTLAKAYEGSTRGRETRWRAVHSEAEATTLPQKRHIPVYSYPFMSLPDILAPTLPFPSIPFNSHPLRLSMSHPTPRPSPRPISSPHSYLSLRLSAYSLIPCSLSVFSTSPARVPYSFPPIQLYPNPIWRPNAILNF